MIWREMGINHSCLDIGVPKEFLNRREIDAIHNQVTRERVPENVNLCDLWEPTFPG